MMADQKSKPDYAITTQQAKQIATIKWLLYKAYNNNVPHELREPFYYDERQQSVVSGKSSNLHLKPAIVYLLAKAELYCLALANIYLDPNYHNLNHCGIIQALARKGVVLSDPQLTETVLLQTSPLKLTAHLCVIEAIMMLYAKEVVTSERVVAAIKKFSSTQQRFVNDTNSNAVIPQWSASEYDQLLLLWISATISALNGRIKRQVLETQANETEGTSHDKPKNDHFRQIPVTELTELSDGVALCALVSYYCPQSLQWQKILVNKPATNADYNHNLHLLYNFCQRCLPFPVFHMSPQDIYPHSINYMRINVIALLVDLFNVLEIHPANCVVSETQNGISASSNSESNFAPAQFEPAYTRRNGYNNLQKCPLTTQQMSVIPNLRNYSNSQNSNSTESRTTNSSPRVDRKSRNNSVSESQNNEQFIVHKGRNIPTLSSMNAENCHKERIEPVAAGKPTSWNDPRKSQITGAGGRRSRRNSFSDDSQLTIENFGGSHENISVLGRNPDKEPAVHVAVKNNEDVVDNDAGARQLRCQMAAQENWSSAAISNLLRENNSDNTPQPPRPNSNASAASSATSGSSASDKVNGMRNFATPPTTAATTLPTAETAEMLESCKVSSQMLNIRLKLEEKRRQIEMDKRRMELNLKKQRQKLNKAAFLQAVSKIENDDVSKSNDVDDDDDDGGGYDNGGGSNDISCDDIDNDSIIAYDEVDKAEVVFNKIHRNPASFGSQVEQKWLKHNEIDVNGEISPKSDRQTPDSDTLDIEKCQKSISEMDSSLHAIQTDLQWLAVKENEMLHAPDTADSPKPYAMSFTLNQDQQQTPASHPLQKILINNHQNQNGFYANTVDYGVPDARANYNTLPNKNFGDYNYADGYGGHTQQHHHLSLIPTVPAKSPLQQAAPATHMMNAYDNDNYYVYPMQQQQHQHQPLHMAAHPAAQNFKTNYHSINVVDNDLRNTNFNYQNSCVVDDMDKMRMQHRNEQQFYLHKPSDNAQPAFQFQNQSPVPNTGYSTPSNMTSFSQRKTWDNSSSSSPIHSPTHMFTSSRYPSKESSNTQHYPESKFKPTPKYADDPANISLRNEGMNAATEFDYSNYFANSRGDVSGRHSSAGSVSIPSPSVDDMAPQCISFIGSQSDGTKTSGSDDQLDDAQLNENVNKLHISNGNRTYRIPSPTNKGQSRPNTHYAFNNEDKSKSEKGFYVSFSSNDDDNFGKSGPFTRFSDRSPIKVPPRFKKALSNSSLNNDKDRPNVKTSPRNKFEQFKKSETASSLRENDFLENRNVQRQNSDEADKAQDKLATDTIVIKNRKNNPAALVINADTGSDPAQVDEMERKKERILLQSLQRRQQQEEMKARKEIELQRRKEQEKQKDELKAKKKEEEKRRRAIILEKHRLKKAIEDAEREGKPIDKELLNAALKHSIPKSNSGNYDGTCTPGAPKPKLRSKNHYANRPRPKTIHIDVGSNLKDPGGEVVNFNLTKKGSSINLAEHNNNNYGMNRRDYYRGSQDLLLAGADIGNTAGTSASSIYSDLTDDDRMSATYPVNGSTCGSIGRRRGSSYKTSRDVSLDRATSRIARPKFSTYQGYPRKSSSLMNLCGSSCDQDSLSYNSRYVTDTDSGLGRATPPHRTSSPAPSNSSPSGPGSLPPSHHSRRLRYDDTASESGGSEYSGLRLYKQPAVKSNRGIIMNAIEYCVFPGEVNRSAKNRILDEINRSDVTKHFLVLFRDSRCQFRALYSYYPENEEVMKLYGTGPKQVTEKMFDKFFKYNSGGKCFAQVHTKHLTVTIDAFTIHNSLWQGKKVNLPNKRDMSLVI